VTPLSLMEVNVLMTERGPSLSYVDLPIRKKHVQAVRALYIETITWRKLSKIY